jgi:hypothetical protein
MLVLIKNQCGEKKLEKPIITPKIVVYSSNTINEVMICITLAVESLELFNLCY